MTDNNYDYFKTNLNELIEQYDGRFVVIKDANIISVYDSFNEAYINTIKTEKLGTFIIQKCVKPENDKTHFAWNNVSFSQVVKV